MARSLVLGCMLLLVDGVALGHAANGNGFVAGFLHPVYGTDHLLAMIAVGLLGAKIGGAAIWQLPVYFPLLMAIGGIVGIRGGVVPAVEPAIALSGVVFGVLLLVRWQIPMRLAIALVAAFAFFHGYAHGKELPNAGSPNDYCVGFVMGTGMLHLTGVALSQLERLSYGWVAIRAMAVVIAGGGLTYLLR